jgi:hypothetical protein
MTASRRHEIERLHDAVSERPPAERAAFLARACGGDEELVRGWSRSWFRTLRKRRPRTSPPGLARVIQ